MHVECNFFGPFRDTVGTKTVERECPRGTTLLELIYDLEEEYEGIADQLLADEETLKENISIAVDGEHVRQLDGEKTELDDGSVVRFAPPVSGGGQPSPNR